MGLANRPATLLRRIDKCARFLTTGAAQAAPDLRPVPAVAPS